jgi:hypothetical protein
MSIKIYILPVVICQISLIFEINKEQTTAFYGAVKRARLKIFAESGDSAVLSAGQYGAKISYARRGASPRDFLITKCLESCMERKKGN